MRILSRNDERKAVLDAPSSRWCTVRLTSGKTYRAFRPFELKELRGRRPHGHPRIGIRRKAAPEAKLVYVEKGTGYLWVVTRILQEDGERLIALRPYGCRFEARIVAERRISDGYRVWDRAVRYLDRVSQ